MRESRATVRGRQRCSCLAKILFEESHDNTQQDESDKAPKYPPPRLMTAAIDRRFFGLPVHQATATSRAAKQRIAPILRAADGGLSYSWSRELSKPQRGRKRP